MNDPTQMMMNRNFAIWHQQQQPIADDYMKFQNPRLLFPPIAGSKPVRTHWKRKRSSAVLAATSGAVSTGVSGYNPPARRFYPKKKFSRFAPYAPRNTTSFIIRAKKSGGIASLVSPCPVTPAVLPTPKFSPTREGLVDMAKEEWGVDGYGSMKGLIRLRSAKEEDDDEAEDGSSESDVEEHLEVERRIDHDLSRFEMVCPSVGEDHDLESRVDDQDTQIAKLEEENLTLKERLFLVEEEMGDLRRRLQLLETRNGINNNDTNNNDNNDDHSYTDNNNSNNVNAIEEASENDGGGDVCSENDGGGDVCLEAGMCARRMMEEGMCARRRVRIAK